MARNRVTFDTKGLKRGASRLLKAPERARTAANRAISTLERRLGPETARAISEDVLNLPTRRVSPHIDVKRHRTRDGDYVAVSASRTRLPLSAYSPRFSRTEGVTVTTWRDSPQQELPHGFRRKDKPGVWQRIPAHKVAKFRPAKRGRADQTAAAPSGLVARLPVVERKGPSMHRVFVFEGRHAGHTDIRPRLSAFVQETLSREIARLLRAET
jgi:hypothetical protein